MLPTTGAEKKRDLRNGNTASGWTSENGDAVVSPSWIIDRFRAGNL